MVNGPSKSSQNKGTNFETKFSYLNLASYDNLESFVSQEMINHTIENETKNLKGNLKCKEEKKLRRHFGLAKDAKFNDAVNLLSLYHPESVQSMYILERCQQLARTSLEKEEITKALNKATILPLETPLIRTSTNTRKILDKLSAKNQKENAVPTTPEEIKYSSPSLLNTIQIKIFGLKCEMKSITDVFFFSKMCKLLDKFNNLYRLAQTEKCQKKLHEHTKSIQAAVTGAIQKIIDFNVINIFDLSVVHRLTPYKNKEGEMLLKNKFLKELKDSVDYYRKEEILRMVVLSKFDLNFINEVGNTFN